MVKRKAHIKSLSELKNVGSATLHDLCILGIESLEKLAQADPDILYSRLEQLNTHQNPCVWDVVAAIIHEARTGEALPWWHWSASRKKRFLQTPLCNHMK